MFFSLLAFISCDSNHKSMMEDTEMLFSEEQFCDLSNESDIALQELFKFLTDSIDSVVPIGCKTFHLSADNSELGTIDPKLFSRLNTAFAKLDSYHGAFVEVCRNNSKGKPAINMRIKTQTVKARSSYQLITHIISNKTADVSKNSMEGIGDELVKLKMINSEIRYSIGVSPEIGFFD